MKKLFLSLGVVLSLTFALAATPASAQLGVGLKNLQKANKNTGLQSNLEDTVGTVIKTVLAMVGTIFLGLTIYAGILWMTASGNEEQVAKATNIIKAAIIGLFITMSAYAITYFVASRVGGSAVGGDEAQPCPSQSPSDPLCNGKNVNETCTTADNTSGVCVAGTASGGITGGNAATCTCQ